MLLIVAGALTAQPPRPLLGRTVQSVIDELRAGGAPLVYGSGLLPSTLTVAEEPAATAPLALAREILAPHGLDVREEGGAWLVARAEPAPAPQPGRVLIEAGAAYAGAPIASFDVQVDGSAARTLRGVDGRAELPSLPAGRYGITVRAPGFLPQRLAAEVVAGSTVTLRVALVEAVAKLDEIVVTASRYDLATRTEPSTADFSRADIENFLSLGDDALRVSHRLPGVANNGFSARPYMRGGAPNEVAVLLDGVRLVEPYHLRDFQSVFSAIDERIVDHVAVHAGGFAAEYGDALSGLMVIEPREPDSIEHELGLSMLYTSVLTSGTFADGRASWLVSGRNSNLDRVVSDEIGQPGYSDVFIRLGVDLGARHRLLFADLRFRDDILYTLDDPGDREQATSDTSAQQAWLKLESDWTERLSSSTWLHATSLESQRHEDVADLAELIGTVDDRRALDAVALKQDWQYAGGERQVLSFGYELERRDAEYRYSSAAQRRGLLATLVDEPALARDIELAPRGDSYALYFEDRLQLSGRVVADVGVRWDRKTYLPLEEADDRFSPRLSLLVLLSARTDLRFSHGRFFQAEGLLDLQVEDGVTEFSSAQRSAHSVFSIEHRFADTVALRAEWYHKDTEAVRPRFENLFEPLVVAPELRASRVLVEPEGAEADGVELFVSSERPVPWWVGVAWANADDTIAGASVPRSWDQDRALSAGVTWPLGSWRISAAASAHRGWPATEVSVVTDPAGEPVAVAGPRNAVRLPSVRKLDFGAAREFALGETTLEFFAEVSNLTNRDNPCCLVYDPAIAPDGSSTLVRDERAQAGITGNIGLLWRF